MPKARTSIPQLVRVIRFIIPKLADLFKKYAVHAVLVTKATRPAEFVLADTALHVCAALVFLDQGVTFRAILHEGSGFLAKPIMQALLIPRTLPQAMLLKLALLTQLLPALGTLQIAFLGKMAPINDLLAVAHRAKEQVFPVIQHPGIIAEANVLFPHLNGANELHLLLGGPCFAPMLQAPEILMPHLFLNHRVEGTLIAHEAEDVVAGFQLQERGLMYSFQRFDVNVDVCDFEGILSPCELTVVEFLPADGAVKWLLFCDLCLLVHYFKALKLLKI